MLTWDDYEILAVNMFDSTAAPGDNIVGIIQELIGAVNSVDGFVNNTINIVIPQFNHLVGVLIRYDNPSLIME